ncbi:MAG TPA: hypothetical protein VK601_07675 [Kofleriaceae bacterium]|nr:hypothetical protein [Kofleriaceae bacterium]
MLAARRIQSIASLVVLLSAPAAFAAEHEPEAKGEDGITETKGGKFSLFGHECKAEEDEGLETTPGSPPLDVDDPGTPGCNGWEINVVTSGEFGHAQDFEAPLLDINYGVGDNIQLKFEVPYLLSKADGASSHGVGPAEIGIKHRFYEDESHERSLAFYPQVEFAIPGTAVAEGEEGSGVMTKLPLLFSTRIAETGKGNVMLTANAAYNLSTLEGTESYVSAALGVGFPLLSKVALMIEGSTEQALTRNMDDVREGYFKANLGLAGPITDHLLWFGSVGQTFASSDTTDSSHTCMALGLRLIAGGP